jgi:centromere-localized protein 2
MPPTEQTILSTFLLAPAPLPTILPLAQFIALFPRSEQSSPEIQRLYRSLQHRRALLTDDVAQNIEDEVKRGNAQRRAVARLRRAEERGGIDDEIVIENTVSTRSIKTLAIGIREEN